MAAFLSPSRAAESDRRPLHNGDAEARRVTAAVGQTLFSGLTDLHGLKHEELFRQFARLHLTERECSAHVPAGGEGVCGCGRDQAWHEGNGVPPFPDGKVRWSAADHTRVRPSSTFGEIDFAGFGNRTERSPYVRVDQNTSPEVLWSLLHDVWQLPTPKLVISVTGGAKLFFMKNRLHNAFKQGLIDVASTTDAWIITGGTSTGVMKYVGEALREYELSSGQAERRRIVAVGIAAWGCIDNRANLVDPSGGGCFPAVYSLRDCTSAGNVAPLDHNHTHFILVDNGTIDKFGTEIELRANLEALIRSKCAASVSAAGIETPVVIIVCEGGPNTLQQTRDAIRREIPAVIIKGSGRAADIIAAAYRLSRPKQQSEDCSVFPANFDEEMMTRIIRNLTNDLDMAEKCLKSIKEVLLQRRLLTIFELDDSNCRDMDKAVLSALLKAKKQSPQSQVDLALIWNRADIARQQIFTLENRKQWQAIALDDVMHAALVQGRDDFVQLFVDNGVHFGRFLSVVRLRDLYKVCLDERLGTMALIFRNLLQRMKVRRHSSHVDKCGQIYQRLCSFGCNRVDLDDEEVMLLSTVGHVVSFLLNDKFKKLYANEKYIVASSTDAPRPATGSTAAGDNTGRPARASPQFDHPEKHLFLWALLVGHRQLARMFWRMSPDPIGGALVASRLLKSLADEAAGQEEVDLSCELQTEAQFYEEMACGVLVACYSQNKAMAHSLLVRELRSWGRTTLFSLAESAQLMNFMQLSCCQTKLNQIWYGHMVDYTQDWKIILVLFCPLFIKLVRFKHSPKPVAAGGGFGGTLARALSPAVSPRPAAPPADDEAAVDKKPRRTVVACGLCLTDPQLRSQSIGVFKALYHFYTSPVTKFYMHMTFYVAFLGLFTFVLLTELEPVSDFSTQGIFEILLWAWALCFFVENLRKIFKREAKSCGFKIRNHMESFWNQLDMLLFVLFLVAFAIRMVGGERSFHRARVVYAITLMFAYIRFMEAFYVSKDVGPKIIMIQRMLKDLLFFICILVVFILSFGIAMQSLLYPHEQFSFHLLIDAVYTPYWQIFGELFMDHIEGSSEAQCAANKSELALHPHLGRLCPQQSWLVPLLFAIYMMLTNVLLLNLLIAMFSYTFQLVQENSEKVWRFYRYSVVHTFFDAPTVPPPFVGLSHAKRFVQELYQRIHGTHYPRAGFKTSLSTVEDLKLTAFEKAGMDRFLARAHKLSVEQMDWRVAESGKRLEKVLEELDDIKECLAGEPESRCSTASSVARQPSVDADFADMQDTLRSQSQLLHELITVLRKSSRRPK